MSKASRAVANRRAVIGFSGGVFGAHAPAQIKLLPGRSYSYGASSSPKTVYVVSVEGEWVTYRYASDLRTLGKSAPLRREQSWVFCDLAHRGTTTTLNQDRVAFSTTGHPVYADRVALLEAKLAGDAERAPEESLDAFIEEVVFLAPGPSADGDLWYAAEEYGGVSGRRLPDGSYIYRVSTTVELARAAKADPRFVEYTGNLDA